MARSAPSSRARAATSRHATEGPAPLILEHREELQTALSQRVLSPLLARRDSGLRMPLSNASVQLVVTSPPYPYIEMWDGPFERDLRLRPGQLARDPRQLERIHTHLARTWKECVRVLQPGGILCINIGDATRSVAGEFRLFPNHVKVVDACEHLGLTSLVPILWKKPTNKPNSFLGSGFAPPNAYVTLDCEHILIFRKGGRREFPPRDLLRSASQFSKAERDLWFSQVWQVRGAPQHDGRASFPEEIPDRLVRMFSVLGDTVLDPFAGTGSTLRAAWRLGRRAVGFESDPVLFAELERSVPREAPEVSQVLEDLVRRYSPPSSAP